MVVEIGKSPNADSRTAQGKVSFEDFQKATDMHRNDVKRVLYELARRLREIGDNHDYTKKTEEEKYYDDYIEAKKNGKDSHDTEWHKEHVRTERHHVNDYTHDDVNLLDILEMICDHCCDELVENGKIGKMEIDSDTLMKAFNNTVELIKSFIRLDENKSDYDMAIEDEI